MVKDEKEGLLKTGINRVHPLLATRGDSREVGEERVGARQA